MENINKRFKELREYLELSQEDFGKSIGLSKSGISNIEKGIRKVTEKHIKIITHELNVNENWLRNGVKPIFNPTREEVTDEFVKAYKLDKLGKDFVKNLLLLSDKDMRTLIEISEAMILKSKIEQQSEKYKELLLSSDINIIEANSTSITPELEAKILSNINTN